jgi:hypothetical protein
MTRTVTKLSQLITIFFPEKLLPHAFKATTTVSISHILICRFSLKKGQISIPDDFKLDLCWWRTLLSSCNEVSLMLSEEWSRADQIFSVDYCLTGCAGCMN